MISVPYNKGNIYRFNYDDVMPTEAQHNTGKRVTVTDRGQRVTVVVTGSDECGYLGRVTKVQKIKKPGPTETK